MTYRGLDSWITCEPDTGERREKCDWCNGKGVRHVVTYWHGHEQDAEAECDECGGSGQIEIGPDGYPRAPEGQTERYFRSSEKVATERDRVQTIVDAVIRNSAVVSYPWATAKVALTKILLDLEMRVGSTDPVLKPLRAHIAAGGGRVE